MNAEDLKYVNTAHPKQDVHKLRPHRPGLFRFEVAAALVPVPDGSSRALDLAGGMAEFAKVLSSKGYAVTFVDLSENNVRHAIDLGYESYKMDLNEGLAHFGHSTFGCVVILEIIEHLIKAEYLIEEIFRVLKPGGSLILSTPNAVWLPERLRVLRGLAPAEEGYHYRFFTEQTIKKMCIREGFSITETKFSTPAFGVNLFRRRVLGRSDRIHLLVPNWAAPVLAQTIYLHAKKPGA